MVSPLASIVAGLGPQRSGLENIGQDIQGLALGNQQRQINDQRIQANNFNLQQQQAGAQRQEKQLNEQDAGRQLQFINRLGKQLLSQDESRWGQLLTPHIPALEAMGYTPEVLQGMDRQKIQDVVAQTDAVIGQAQQPEQTASQRDRASLLQDLESDNDQVRDSAAISLGLKGKATGAAPQVVMVAGVPHVFDKQTSRLIKAEIQGQEITADTVAEDAATIAGAKTQAVEDVKAAVKLRVNEAAKSKEGANKLADAMPLFEALSSADLGIIYGRGESLYPSLMRSQAGIDLMAQKEQLVNMIKLGARGQLKGQGTISDGETKMLADAATLLGNPDISPDLAASAIEDSMRVLRRSSGQGEKVEPKSFTSSSGIQFTVE